MASPRSKAAAPKADVTPAPMPPPQPMAAAPIAARPAPAPLMPLVPGRAVALNRAGVPIQRVAAETGVNQFYIPPHLPPPGWSWEWKEETVIGEVRHGEAARQAQVGWEPVMADSYPGIFMPEYDDKGQPVKGPVRRGGLMLKERPMALTLEAMHEEKRKADEKIGAARHQYSRLDTRGTTTAEFDHSAQRASGIKQSYEQVNYPQTNPAGPGIPPPYRQPID